MASRGGKERSEKEAQEGGGICIHKADFTSLYNRNLLNIVKQLYSNNKEYYKRPKHREQMYGYQGEKEAWDELGDLD